MSLWMPGKISVFFCFFFESRLELTSESLNETFTRGSLNIFKREATSRVNNFRLWLQEAFIWLKTSFYCDILQETPIFWRRNCDATGKLFLYTFAVTFYYFCIASFLKIKFISKN